jgi:hypothetical protein
MAKVSEAVLALKSVTFRYKSDGGWGGLGSDLRFNIVAFNFLAATES